MKKFLILLAAITAGFAAKAQTDAVKITFLSWLTNFIIEDFSWILKLE